MQVTAEQVLDLSHNFFGVAQRQCVRDAIKGEEGKWFAEKVAELAALVATMPKTGESCSDAIAHLHYFTGGADFYIVEKDMGSPDDDVPGQQHQAFGLADIFGDGGELGYISLPEIFANGAELDLHWTPRPLSAIRAKMAA